jgi:hypothetical protein
VHKTVQSSYDHGELDCQYTSQLEINSRAQRSQANMIHKHWHLQILLSLPPSADFLSRNVLQTRRMPHSIRCLAEFQNVWSYTQGNLLSFLKWSVPLRKIIAPHGYQLSSNRHLSCSPAHFIADHTGSRFKSTGRFAPPTLDSPHTLKF